MGSLLDEVRLFGSWIVLGAIFGLVLLVWKTISE